MSRDFFLELDDDDDDDEELDEEDEDDDDGEDLEFDILGHHIVVFDTEERYLLRVMARPKEIEAYRAMGRLEYQRFNSITKLGIFESFMDALEKRVSEDVVQCLIENGVYDYSSDSLKGSYQDAYKVMIEGFTRPVREICNSKASNLTKLAQAKNFFSSPETQRAIMDAYGAFRANGHAIEDEILSNKYIYWGQKFDTNKARTLCENCLRAGNIPQAQQRKILFEAFRADPLEPKVTETALRLGLDESGGLAAGDDEYFTWGADHTIHIYGEDGAWWYEDGMLYIETPTDYEEYERIGGLDEGTASVKAHSGEVLSLSAPAIEDGYKTVAAGASHTAGLRADGTVAVAGYDGTDAHCDLSDWENIVAISARQLQTVGLRADGTVAVAGGQIGKYSEVPGWTDIVAVAAGYHHIVGLKADGTVVAEGLDNIFGNCDVSDWTDIVAIAAGRDHTVGLHADGTVVAVGYTWSGLCDVSDWTDIVAIDANEDHTVGLRADGTVVAAGTDLKGQCDVGDWRGIVAVAAGKEHTVGLYSDGTVVATGSNDEGQCDVSGWTDIVAIAAGDAHTVGLRADGTLVATGLDDKGQCDVSDWENIALPGSDGSEMGAVPGQTGKSEYPTFDFSDTVEDTTDSSLEFFIENCDTVYFSVVYFQGFDEQDCEYARSGIYARSGRKFDTKSLADYFARSDWYDPHIAPKDFTDSMLNECQHFNLAVVMEYEKENGF